MVFKLAERHVAIIPMSEKYQYSHVEQSLVLSAFFWGYTPMNLGGAILCRHYGAKNVLGYGLCFWSLCAILSPLAASVSIKALFLCRLLLGIGEGVAFPSIYHFLAGWIPKHERGRATSTFTVGVHLGAAAALFISPKVIKLYSWEMVFYLFGSLGFLWAITWFLFAYDKHMEEEGDELDDIRAGQKVSRTKDEAGKGKARWGEKARANATETSSLLQHILTIIPSEMRVLKLICCSRSCLALTFAQFTMSWAHYTILSWLPTYFKNVFGVSAGSLSFTYIPYAVMAVVANFGGWIADFLCSTGMKLGRVRRTITFVANTGAGIFILIFCSCSSISTAIIAIGASLSFMVLNTGGFESSFFDIAPQHMVGTLKGFANIFGSLSGVLALPFSTLVLKHARGSWPSVFASLAFFFFSGAAVFSLFYGGEKVLTFPSPEDVESVDDP